ncbi:hypothetical protein [Moraxella bovis]|uniref:Uncharacterized protein n=1 Tax=Moraxella bovis TaxID=476 RepID=A0A378PR79_MORBO|nr:hypothetical protein [Moraxella bovis]UZA03125.1 hypothetical protein LP092_14540 [Moraxella bovis]STY90760.1 Uncharacterised protein [Moraxella bovis]
MKIDAFDTIKSIVIAICLGTLLMYGVFVAIVVLGALSFDAKSSEAKVRAALLVASNYQKDGVLDIRSAIREKNIPPDEEWQRLYKHPIVPPLDEPLSGNEKQLCNMIRQYEDGRSRFYDIHFFGVSMLMPIRYIWDRTRGGSTALQSAVAKVLGRGSFGKVGEIYNTAGLYQLPEEIKCRIIISALDGNVVQKSINYQTIRGGYALSDLVFDKSFDELDFCELAFLSTAFRTPLSSISSKMYLNHRVYTYAVKNNRFSRCLKFDVMAEALVDLQIDKHPISISGMYRDTPLSVGMQDYIDFKEAVSEAQIQLEKQLKARTVVEVTIKQGDDTIRIDSLNPNTGFGSKHTPASLSKLLVAKTAIESGEDISSERLRKLLCHSDPEATADLFDVYQKDIINQAQKYNLIHEVSLKRALSSEDARWSSDDILLFAEDYVSLLQGKKKIPNAFGQGCTMSVLRSLVVPRHAIFAKSGTAKGYNKTVAKLLLFAIKYEKHSPIILVRVEGENNDRGLCEGEACFDNSLLKPFVIATLKFTDKQSLNSKKGETS